MSLRAQLIGCIETAGISAASSRTCPTVSQAHYATSAAAPVGGGRVDRRAGHGHLAGITALELGSNQLITKVTRSAARRPESGRTAGALGDPAGEVQNLQQACRGRRWPTEHFGLGAGWALAGVVCQRRALARIPSAVSASKIGPATFKKISVTWPTGVRRLQSRVVRSAVMAVSAVMTAWPKLVPCL